MTLQRPRGREGRTQLRILIAGLASAALLVGAVAPALAASPVRQAAAAPGVRKAQVTIKKVNANAKMAPLGAVKTGVPARDEIKPKTKSGENPKKSRKYANPSGRLAMPMVPSLPVVAPSALTGRSGAVGWDAISGNEMRYASPDGRRWNYSLEPPDMALCVGNGYVVQGVNGAIQIRNNNGVALTDVTPMNYFLGYGPEYPFGTSVGDPVCRYDPGTGRFFLSLYLFDGYYTSLGNVLAISNSGNPLGSWSVWELPDMGNYTLAGCVYGCFPDYPQLGLDQNGVWLTNNEFDWLDPFGTPYAGTTIWGISKRMLIDSGGTFLLAWVWGLGYDGGVPTAFTVQPASTPNGAYDTSSGGTQYFMSTRDMAGTYDNVLEVWAITGTNTLNLTGSPGPSWPQRVTLPSLTYGCDCWYSAPAGGATQKYGPYPLGQGGSPPISPGQQLGRMDTNDDRMHPVVYSNGMLWGAASTVMMVAGSSRPTVGVAWFTVNVNTMAGLLVAGIRGQGYIGVKNSFLWFPAVAVSNSVRGVIVMTFSGPDFYPSVAYTQFNPYTGASEVRVAAAGVLPADGFTAYSPYSRNGTERWGDYSAAATDERGNVWIATEYVGPKPRAAFMNWGTWIGVVYPY